MFDSEHNTLKRGEHHIILQEYNDIVDDLKRELEICKTEQNGIRTELQTLHIESKNSSDAIRDYISHIHLEECGNVDMHDKIITNLKERITVLQMEKDSAVQLWQVSMKAIDALEQELKVRPIDNRDVKFYEEQLMDVRQSYSEAIRALESKLLQAKENFAKQQSLWMTNKETMETLQREKREVAKRLEELQQNVQQKDRNSQQTIQSLTEELYTAKAEIQRINHLKSDLEKRLSESRKIASNIAAKDKETKCKMSETLDLVESAIRERDMTLQREAQIAEQKAGLEARLASVVKEHATEIRDAIARLKDAHEHSVKEYLLEIKELQSELREKTTLLDRSHRETRLAEEELERVRRDSGNLLEKSAAKIVNIEQTLKHADSKLETTDEAYRKQYDSEMQQLREKIVNLEQQLASNKKLKQMETQLTRVMNAKKSVVMELKSLQSTFDREIFNRNNERDALESKIRQFEANLQKQSPHCAENKSSADITLAQSHPQSHADTIKKYTLDVRFENMEHNCQLLLEEQLSKQQEKFDKKTQEITEHVKIYKDLIKQYRDEATFLVEYFDKKYKELKTTINTLKKEKAELQKLLASR